MSNGNIFVEQISLEEVKVLSGAGDPNGILTAPIGSLYIRKDVAGLYKNTDGATTWELVPMTAP